MGVNKFKGFALAAVAALGVSSAAHATVFTADTSDLTLKATNINQAFDHIFFSAGYVAPAGVTTDSSAGIVFPANTDMAGANAATIATRLTGAGNNNVTFTGLWLVDLNTSTRYAYNAGGSIIGSLTTSNSGLEDDIKIWVPASLLNLSHAFGVEIAGTVAASNTPSLTKVTGAVTYSTLEAPVPEAATWLMMVGGFGLMGASMRRRQTKVTFA